MAYAPIIAIALIAFTLTGLLGQVRKRLLAGAQRGEGRRKLYGQLAHVAMVVMFVGFAGNAFSRESAGTMGPGESLQVGDYNLQFLRIRTGSNREMEYAATDLHVVKNGEELGVVSPSKRFYNSHPQQPTSEVAILSSVTEDIFVALGEIDFDSGRAFIKAIINPMVMWVWIGAFLLVLATILATLPEGAFTTLLRFDENFRQRARTRVTSPAIALLIFLGMWFVANLPLALSALGAVLIIRIAMQLTLAVRCGIQRGFE